jgi:hypothetical protein
VHDRKDVCRKDLQVDATSKPNKLSPCSALRLYVKTRLVVDQVRLSECGDNIELTTTKATKADLNILTTGGQTRHQAPG